MRKKLSLKFLLAYLAFAVISFAVISTFMARFAYRNCVRQSARDLRSEAAAIADQCSNIYSGIDTDEQTYYERLTWAGSINRHSVWVMDIQRNVEFDSAGVFTGRQVAFDPTDDPAYYRTGSFYGSFSQEQLSVYAPITANLKTYGYVIIHEPLTDIAALSDSMLIPTYITFLIIFALSLLLLLMIHLWVMKPLRRITEAAKAYASGNLKYHLKLRSRDEMGYLADTLNYMAGELSRTEEYQRKFISNVSHDFRSPLTSIKGYIQAIQDGIIPPEEQSKYLDIVVNETDRLTGLTQNMLQLNALDESGLSLDYSNFDINTVIKDTCALFEGRCRAREIRFELIFSDTELPVHADRPKIQQVIYNLVDNAIKFSPNRSQITIEAFDRYEKTFISVKDQGQGISKDNIKKIWTRFYKSDESRGKDKKGTGLGLAIVKEIITAHRENIDVVSTEGVGTEFIFTLTRAEEADL